jgi:Ras-related protein Rab-6A
MHHKVVFLGDSGVGKTSIIKRRTENAFSIQMACTIGVDHEKVEIITPAGIVELFLWDTAGQEQFCSMMPHYLRNSSVAVFVCSAIDPISIDSVQTRWLTLMQSFRTIRLAVAVVNKMDLMDDHPRLREDLTAQLGAKFASVYFVSAKTNDGIDSLFLDIAIQVAESSATVPLGSIQLDGANGSRKGDRCC